MNDLFGLIAKFLPVGVIAGLVGIFYLLDVFSVRPNFDGAPPQRPPAIATTPATGPKPAAVAQEPSSPALSPPGTSSLPQAGSAAPFPSPPVSSSPALAPSAIEMSDAPLDDPSATASMTEDAEAKPGGQQAPPTRYVPPGAIRRQPITRGVNGEPPPAQIPSNEIQQDDGARIEAETQQLIEQPESNPEPAAPGENGRGG